MIEKIEKVFDQITLYVLTFCLSMMILLSLFSIIARFFSYTSMWIDPLVRHLVFLCAFLGGSLATGNNQNIKIDILPKYLEYSNDLLRKKYYLIMTSIFTLIIIGFLFKSGLQFFLSELQYGKITFLGLHSSILTSIIPFGMFIIFTRLILKTLSYVFCSQEKQLE
ncbi:MAG: TRAP transporter small permease [Halobacteriovoraceae bacterium]|nr:TRAP transporter small permease [Halobacteriovoraceae bacterium]